MSVKNEVSVKDKVCELEATAKSEAMKRMGVFMTPDRERAVRTGVRDELSKNPGKLNMLCSIFAQGTVFSGCNPDSAFLKRRTNSHEKAMTPKQPTPVTPSNLPDDVLRDIYSSGHRTYGN